METWTDARAGTSYTFRRYEPGDAADFLDLYATLWDEHYDREWFQWRYEENPFLDHVPIFVAEADGSIVAARPFLGLPMVVGDTSTLALLTADTMVHPDHQRRGLFTSLTEAAIEFYEAREPAFVFNQPNAASRPGYRDLGWRELAPVETYYRVQNPRPVIESRYVSGPLLPSLLTGVNSAVRTVTDTVRRRRQPGTTRAFRGVRSHLLSTLYDQRPPSEIHAQRSEAYYDWRFGSPAWRRTTYVADDGSGPTVGLLARTRTTPAGPTVTQIADVVPMVGERARARRLAALVEHLLTDRRDVDIVAAPSMLLPTDLLSRLGFHSDGTIPIKWLSSHDTALCVRSLRPDDAWEIDGVPLDDPEGWRLGFGEKDTV
jgi:GNAT superfamily N-acetyltransferase